MLNLFKVFLYQISLIFSWYSFVFACFDFSCGSSLDYEACSNRGFEISSGAPKMQVSFSACWFLREKRNIVLLYEYKQRRRLQNRKLYLKVLSKLLLTRYYRTNQVLQITFIFNNKLRLEFISPLAHLFSEV